MSLFCLYLKKIDAMQKVISINIDSNDVSQNLLEDGRNYIYKEFDFPKLNGLLDEGWEIKESFSTISNSTGSRINVTFILERD